MTNTSPSKEQNHPRYDRDRLTINSLLSEEKTDYNLAELARLKIRYQGFPGARDLQNDLDRILQLWGLTTEELFVKTRAIHHVGGIYKSHAKREEEDWN
ncbi:MULTISPECIES: DUF3288 family protein [Cylindrospermopsis]|uniref:DUF3288 family protein n=1 Tax=Cylindrospermopsis curvispora GIHE-G1 TaxID=2666332 RepID=A0A7H0F316_9CYAN|nr:MULTISPECIES: DUF3288 family protein [Cylindrospermopsis]QNP30432.1 DUF3288 family protein [Cylindrospermopsis curvispora GIHE-G1]UJS05880.1 DUF3288 family protein [Cylindrospermopsis raciborskii KLL07]BAZ90138.1 hypothetical protein NIES932_16330 [Raphidiopsis curvata NIES-932]